MDYLNYTNQLIHQCPKVSSDILDLTEFIIPIEAGISVYENGVNTGTQLYAQLPIKVQCYHNTLDFDYNDPKYQDDDYLESLSEEEQNRIDVLLGIGEYVFMSIPVEHPIELGDQKLGSTCYDDEYTKGAGGIILPYKTGYVKLYPGMVSNNMIDFWCYDSLADLCNSHYSKEGFIWTLVDGNNQEYVDVVRRYLLEGHYLLPASIKEVLDYQIKRRGI